MKQIRDAAVVAALLLASVPGLAEEAIPEDPPAPVTSGQSSPAEAPQAWGDVTAGL